MRAIVIHAARDLRIEDRPTESPGPGQVGLRLATGGVCGSDLHYYNHGGFGAVRLREPMILGHEVSAYVETLGPGVTGFTPGQLVAVFKPELAVGQVPLVQKEALLRDFPRVIAQLQR